MVVPAGQRGLDINSDFACLEGRRRYILDFEQLFADENRRFHRRTLADAVRGIQSANRRFLFKQYRALKQAYFFIGRRLHERAGELSSRLAAAINATLQRHHQPVIKNSMKRERPVNR